MSIKEECRKNIDVLGLGAYLTNFMKKIKYFTNDARI